MRTNYSRDSQNQTVPPFTYLYGNRELVNASLIGSPFGGGKRFLRRCPNRLIIISCMFQECWPTWPFKRPFCALPRRPRLVKLHPTKKDRKCRGKPSKVHCGYQFQMSHCLLSGRKKVLRGGKISASLIFIRSSLTASPARVASS